MTFYYSPSTGGFYCPRIHGKAVPRDALAVNAADHARLLDGQAAGRSIVAGPDGAPTLADPAPPTDEQQLADLRAERDRLLRESDFTQMPDSPLSSAKRAQWRIYRQALRDLPMTVADLSAIAWPLSPSH